MFLQVRESIRFKESKITHLESTKYLTIRPIALRLRPYGYRSIAHEVKPNGLLTRGP